MKVSGKEIAQKILQGLKEEIKSKKLKPSLAIILASHDSNSLVYVNNKFKAAEEIGVQANVYKFPQNRLQPCLDKIDELNKDESVHGIIIQYPVYNSWNFDDLLKKISLKKDVDGFLENSPFYGATALGVWQMLKKFAEIEGFNTAEEFLSGKKIIMIGKGRAAGKPTIRLLKDKSFDPIIVDSKTQNTDEVIKTGDVVISATGKRNIVRGDNIKKGGYVIGIGAEREDLKVFGDIDEQSLEDIAKLYCPTIGGIGPLTVACLLKNVVQSAHKDLLRTSV